MDDRTEWWTEDLPSPVFLILPPYPHHHHHQHHHPHHYYQSVVFCVVFCSFGVCVLALGHNTEVRRLTLC
jgi:hypothetical protein